MRRSTRRAKRRNAKDQNTKIPVHIALKEVSYCIKFIYAFICGCQAGDQIL